MITCLLNTKNKYFVLAYLQVFLLIFNNIDGQILTEIMFNPLEANGEFIEIFNKSDTTIDLSFFKIKYYSSSPDKLISADSLYWLLPNQYAVVFEADYEYKTGQYKDNIPDNTLILFIEDNAFGSSGMSNSSDRKIILINSIENQIDSIIYTADNTKGFSDERVTFLENEWLNSKKFGGTPGRKNSVSKVDYDLAIVEMVPSSNYVIVNGSIKLKLGIKNLGNIESGNFNVKVSNDSLNHLLYSRMFENLQPGDSIIINVNLDNLKMGENRIVAEVLSQIDEDLENNTHEIVVSGIAVNEKKWDILINEVMYAPVSNEPEWIEIYNNSEKELTFLSYKVADRSDTVSIGGSPKVLYPEEYLVIADDSSILKVYPELQNYIISNIPTLNNSGDEIILMDSLGRVIDSLSYSSEMGGKDGKSLERISVENSSIDGNWKESKFPTPGRVNSVSQKEHDLCIDTLFFNPSIPFIETDINFTVQVTNKGKNIEEFTIDLFINSEYDNSNYINKDRSKKLFVDSGFSVSYNFQYSHRVTNEIITLVALLNLSDDDSTNNIKTIQLSPAYKWNSIVLNEIMYYPSNLEPEWIELYNKTDYEINLQNWSIGDILTNPTQSGIDQNIIIEPKNYLVITKNESIQEYHRTIPSKLLENNFPNLNNDEDGVVLRDAYNHAIDSIIYSKEWSKEKGKSLERINIDNNTLNKNNWENSIDIEGSTPGRINSISPKEFDLQIIDLTTYPAFPTEGEYISLFSMIKNNGSKDANGFSLQYECTSNGNSIFNEQQSDLFLDSRDSLIVTSLGNLQLLDTTVINVKLDFEYDEDIINNKYEKFIIPGFNSKSVLINEIMFKPIKNEDEWIELINNTEEILNLKNWMIFNKKAKVIICEEDFNLNPQEYLILCKNQEWLNENKLKKLIFNLPELNNINDEITLLDFRDAPIDNVKYKVSKEFKTGVSLERIDITRSSDNMQNWNFSISEYGSTPGKNNSVSTLPCMNYSDVIITELMYDPINENSQFIEIFNRSTSNIQIAGWKLQKSDDDKIQIIDKSYLLPSEDYFIIAADSSIYQNYEWLQNNTKVSIVKSLDLPKSGKAIDLYDIRGKVIDSIRYDEKWHNSSIQNTKNISLELINTELNGLISQNWSSSVSEYGATPCKENSINIKYLSSKSKLAISPNPFSPDNDGFEDYALINYNLSEPISQIRVRIFDSKGRYIKSIANNLPAGSKGSIVFDGLDKNKNPLKVGIYILLFEAVNSNNINVEVIKDVVVIARKL